MEETEKKKKLRVSFFKMIVIIISTYLLAYAWLFTGELIQFNEIGVDTDPVNVIEISLDNGTTWENIADLNISNDFTFAQIVSSNGIDFYYAHTKEDDGTPITFEEAVTTRDYLEYKVLFRATAAAAIFLENSSYINPAVGTTSNDLIGEDLTRQSIYGDFSKDLIAGAVRVGIVENDIVGEVHTPQTTAKLVWAPNKNYELSYTGGVYSASITSTASQDYSYIKVTNSTTFEEDRVLSLKDNINADYTTKSAGGDPVLTYISDENIKSITIRVWVEGNDREAITPLKGGIFKISLAFVGITKAFDNVPPTVSENFAEHSIIGFNSTMEYSIDYGNNWITYATDPEPYINDGTTVYVRKSETTSTFASVYETLEF